MSDTTKALMPVNYDTETGTISIPHNVVPLLTEEQSAEAHGTTINSLKITEMVALSGVLNVKEFLHAMEFLAKYQFLPAARRQQKAPTDKSFEEYLREMAGV